MSGERTFVTSSRSQPTLGWEALPVLGAKPARRASPLLALVTIAAMLALAFVWAIAA